MDRYICVHGHFYQPPRESPWLEAVEQQDDAYPFHDWNERITAECYAPNTRARILDDQGRIVRLVNNYERISFNLGPTLLSWLADEDPDTYAGVLAADRASAVRFDGHGSAMAQVYGHAILPLANERDRRTQVRWGITDFRHRFGRDPQGMWLAEAAVDEATLETLADEGIRFTVLSPYQAARTRPADAETWTDVRGGHVDPTRPYRVTLPSGRHLAVFFYDGPLSQAVAFEGLLDSSERFERRLLDGFGDRAGPQLVHIATDGESYGHHHRHGEMALAATLDRLEQRGDVTLTNYSQYLALFPPTHEAEVVANSSWSCAHGVERWRNDCGCGGEAGAHQQWRAPLRAALDGLSHEAAVRFEAEAEPLLRDPWGARDRYLEVVLNRDGRLEGFLARERTRALGDSETTRVLQLLELQRYALLMYTSCGWFFDDLARPEPVQVLRYAARVLQLITDLTGDDLEPAFLSTLEPATANDPADGNGRDIYERLVRPAVATLEHVAAHAAIAGLVRRGDDRERIGAYEVRRDDHELLVAGRTRLAYGRLRVRSVVTRSEAALEFGVLHLGDHNVTCGLRPRGDDADYEQMCTDLDGKFETADVPGVIRALDRHLGQPQYSLHTLFRDERRDIVETVLKATLEEVEASYRAIYRGRAPLMRFLADAGITLPTALSSAADVVVNAELTAELASSSVDAAHVHSLLEEADRFDVTLDVAGLGHTFAATVDRLAHRVHDHLTGTDAPFDAFDRTHDETLARIRTLLALVPHLPFEVDLAPAQNVLWQALCDHRGTLQERADAGDATARRWLTALGQLAESVGIVPPAPGRRP